jgi:hypothetical protein
LAAGRRANGGGFQTLSNLPALSVRSVASVHSPSPATRRRSRPLSSPRRHGCRDNGKSLAAPGYRRLGLSVPNKPPFRFRPGAAVCTERFISQPTLASLNVRNIPSNPKSSLSISGTAHKPSIVIRGSNVIIRLFRPQRKVGRASARGDLRGKN